MLLGKVRSVGLTAEPVVGAALFSFQEVEIRRQYPLFISRGLLEGLPRCRRPALSAELMEKPMLDATGRRGKRITPAKPVLSVFNEA